MPSLEDGAAESSHGMKAAHSWPAMRHRLLPTENQRGGSLTKDTMTIMKAGQSWRGTGTGRSRRWERATVPVASLSFWVVVGGPHWISPPLRIH
jgi:hypothetical protein